LKQKNIILNNIVYRKIYNSHEGTMIIKMNLTLPNNIIFSDSRKDIFINNDLNKPDWVTTQYELSPSFD
jgi:hypothetical protein